MRKIESKAAISRRCVIRSLTAAGIAAAIPRSSAAQVQSIPPWHTDAIAYLNRLRRADGGFGWDDQDHSHLTPTFAAIGALRHLNHEPIEKPKLAEYVRTHHPMRLKKLEQEHRQFEFEQIQGLLWLGEDASSFRDQVSRWKKPTVYLKQYEQQGYPVFRFDLTAFSCRKLLGSPMDDLNPDYVEYLAVRRRANGSFNNTPATDGGDGHICNTWHGLSALAVLGREREMREPTIAWLRSCQLPNGGFTYQPNAPFGGNDDASYTWGAIRSLKLLGEQPANRDAAIAYLLSLRNADGGFADRPGWLSNAQATYYVIDALAALDALNSPAPAPRPAVARPALPSNLKVFTVQVEAHGQGSPTEAVDLARSLRIHLWGAKNAKPGWIAKAQAIADEAKVPVQFSVADEEYGTWVNVPGLGTYSHTSDVIAPANSDFGPSVASKGILSWPQIREQRIAPLMKARGRIIWQFGENDELTRIYLDDSLSRGGYAAISTFHFGNPDFVNSEPFLQRYRGQMPFIGLQDAHGNEPWWFADMTTGFRTVFLATEPTWDAWLNALSQNWVVAIRHDANIGNQTWMHSGDDRVLEFVKQHESDWRWWNNESIARPMVSIVAVRPQDQFEAARPRSGITLRVRCARENTTQGLPRAPIAELQKMIVDGSEVATTLVAPKPANQPAGQAFADHYHTFHIESPTSGQHFATAHVRVIATGTELTRSIGFSM